MIARAALLVALAVWTLSFLAGGQGAAAESFLHLPNLVFHEAGHVIFAIFGPFMAALGGSVLQLLVPAAVSVAFLRQDDPFGAAIGLWWLGENLLDLAPYIADARRLEMTLLGGRTGAEVEGHDWEYILTSLGWLHHDQTLGAAAHWTGLVVMAAALAWGARVVWRRRAGYGTL